MFAKLQPEQDHRDGHHRSIVLCQLLIARGDPPTLLESIDQPLHLVPLPIHLPVESSLAPLILLVWDHRSHPVSARISPNLPTRVALVPTDLLRLAAGSPASSPPNRPLLQQSLKLGRVMSLPSGQQDGDGTSLPIGSHVQLGREAAPTPP